MPQSRRLWAMTQLHALHSPPPFPHLDRDPALNPLSTTFIDEGHGGLRRPSLTDLHCGPPSHTSRRIPSSVNGTTSFCPTNIPNGKHQRRQADLTGRARTAF